MSKDYEIHLTLTAGGGELTYEQFVQRSKELGWKASVFEHDDVDGIAGKWFLTTHASSEPQAIDLVKGMVHGLECSDFTVERSKIELIIFDTKRGDKLTEYDNG